MATTTSVEHGAEFTIVDANRRLKMAMDRQSRAMTIEAWLQDQAVIDRCEAEIAVARNRLSGEG